MDGTAVQKSRIWKVNPEMNFAIRVDVPNTTRTGEKGACYRPDLTIHTLRDRHGWRRQICKRAHLPTHGVTSINAIVAVERDKDLAAVRDEHVFREGAGRPTRD